MARRAAIGFLALAALLASGCGFLLPVERRTVPRLPAAPMKTATLQQLVASFNQNAEAVHNLQLKLDMKVTSGGPRTGVETTNKWAITSYLFIEKPDRIRLYGNLSPLGKVFDMASNGSQFEVSIPPKSIFYTGHVDSPPAVNATPMERLRPNVILDSMLINPIRIDAGDHVVPINDRAETFAEYGVIVDRPSPDGYDHVIRRIVFSRHDLLPDRQIIYDQNGFPATTVTYAKYVNVNGVPVPTQITISRPKEEYTINFKVDPTHIVLNPPDWPADTWQLTPPSGYKVIDLDKAAAGSP